MGAAINGGVLLAMAGRALGLELAADPIVVSAYYLSAARAGVAAISVRKIMQGKATSVGEASITQVDKLGATNERVRVVGTYGNAATQQGAGVAVSVPPDVPPPHRCVPIGADAAGFFRRLAILRQLDLRFNPAHASWITGQPTGRGIAQAWLRMPDARRPDALFALLATDVLTMVGSDLGDVGWTPTVQLTAHIRALPSPGWLLVSNSARNFVGGFMEHDTEIWDEQGVLVACSRQLVRVAS
jgi:acyl-CoA thioesterase